MLSHLLAMASHNSVDDYDPSDTSGFRKDLLERYMARARELAEIRKDWTEIELILKTEDQEKIHGGGLSSIRSISLPWRRKGGSEGASEDPR